MPQRWQRKVGGYGHTVRVEEREEPGDNVVLKAWDPVRENYRERSLRYGIRRENGMIDPEARREAVKEARELSDRLDEGHGFRKRPTVERVFSLFEREEIGPEEQGEERRRNIKTALKAWRSYLGKSFDLSDLSLREWRGMKRDRSTGAVDARGRRVAEGDRRPVGDRTVKKTLQVLRQVCRWAAGYRTRAGNWLMDRDPTRGFDLPSENNPSRPVCTERQYRELLKAAGKVNINGAADCRAPLREILKIARHTGRRRGAIVALRWRDWLPERTDKAPHGRIRWRAEEDKVGRLWITPVREEVRQTLENLESRREDGERWIFPAPQTEKHVEADRAGKWLARAKEKAEIEFPHGFGFHALRRWWANERKDLPDVNVADAGGWKDPETLRRVYHTSDDAGVRDAVLRPGT